MLNYPLVITSLVKYELEKATSLKTKFKAMKKNYAKT